MVERIDREQFTMQDCIFCRIVRREMPSEILMEDERILAFPDISPQAPTHVLVIPKKHMASLAEAARDDSDLLGHLLWAAGRIARERNLESGFRVVLNTGAEAGQTVFHIHLHLLGGRTFAWPPG